MIPQNEITILDAELIAQQRVKSAPYSEYNLSIPKRLALPNGWRFAYDSFVGGFRVRQTMLILFVDKTGKVTAEWDDFAQEPNKKEWVENAAQALPTIPTLPSLSTAFNQFEQEYSAEIEDKFKVPLSQVQIETTEAVWSNEGSNEKDQWTLCWRFCIREGLRHFVLMVGCPSQSPSLKAPYINLASQSKSVARDWDLGRARFRRRSGNLTIKLKEFLDLPKEKEHLRSQWAVWSCMAQVAEFLERLGYGRIGSHNIRVQHLASDTEVRGASYSTVNSVPTISFLRGKGWAEDPSIVLHELGHALWYLLYTRPPQSIDRDQYQNEQEGIEEGFADYFAATQLADGNTPIEIGGKLKRTEAGVYKLPRPVDGQPFEPPPSPDEHEIGRKWGNMLWDFRTRVGKEKADSLILKAHLSPQPVDNAASEPLARYFQSLEQIATREELDFNEWHDLAKTHQIERPKRKRKKPSRPKKLPEEESRGIPLEMNEY